MAQSDSVTPEDVELLRSQQASDRGGELTTAQAEQLAALAGRLADVVELPVEARGARLRQILAVPDVELVREAASSIRQRDAGRGEAEGAREAVRQLDALAIKLAAYLPPRNGG